MALTAKEKYLIDTMKKRIEQQAQEITELNASLDLAARDVDENYHARNMTNDEIMEAILENDAVNEMYEALRVIREENFKRLEDKFTEQNAVLRLIKKLAKEQTIIDILSD